MRCASLSLTLPLLVFVAGTSTGSSYAQPSSDAAVREADLRFQEGKELYRQRKYGEARIKFLQACAAHRTSNCPKNLGLAEHALGLYAEAAAHLGEYLRSKDPGEAPTPTIKKMYEEALTRTGHLEIEAPVGAEVFADGTSVGRTPFADVLHVAPGSHALKAVLVDGRTVAASESVDAGQTRRVSLLPKEEPTATPSLSTSATTSAFTVPPPPTSGAPTAPTAPTTTPASVPANHAARDVLRWGSVSIGALGLGLGIAFTMIQRSKTDDLHAFQMSHPGACATFASPDCMQGTGISNDRDTFQMAAITSFVVGGVALASSVALWLFWSNDRENRTGMWIAPSVDATNHGVTMGGRF